ncbi:hypothetical protein T4E_2786 [Trichinella pseudospiralis]|uniref:Uncharacterized protein n=1 Tax=Trichinella pseudospiralis TaxID=6337 RepID=A0A0V0XP10_TRIPS|nr:hypothetical protein T4E_5253 [Trichinella pseudospiralis]KRX89707.1 hypothetical protein T4E_2786 [Trichinella pseudospiralis]
MDDNNPLATKLTSEEEEEEEEFRDRSICRTFENATINNHHFAMIRSLRTSVFAPIWPHPVLLIHCNENG